MRRNLATLLALVLAFASASVLALGLGEIRLNSYLNQRLDAEIELISATADELNTLEVGLADWETFERQGIPRLPELSDLKFRVVRRPNGTAYVHITSSKPVKEPFLTLLIEADWSRGRLLREYTLLLDPPTFQADRAAAQAAAEAAAAPVTEEAPAEATPADILQGDAGGELAAETASGAAAVVAAGSEDEAVDDALPETADDTSMEQGGDAVSIPPLEDDQASLADQAAEEASAAEVASYVASERGGDLGGEYGPIQRNETLWGIAQRLRPDSSITMNQMMLAIFRANPEAFEGNINRLKAGYVLRIPEYDEITSWSAREAFLEAKQQNEEWQFGATGGDSMYAAEDSGDDYAAEEEPSLSLVAPDESSEDAGFGDEDSAYEDEYQDSYADTSSGMADDSSAALAAGDDADSGAVDLGVEESGEERLATVESETFQAMQDSDAQGAAIEEPTEDIGTESAADAEESYEDLPPVLPGDPLADQAGADQSGTEQPVDAAGDMDSDAAGDTMDDTVAGDSLAETDSTDMGAADGVTADTEAADEEEAPTPVVRRRPEPSMVDKALGFVTSPIGLGAIGGLLVMVILVAFMIRKRRSDAAAQTSAEMTGWDLDDEGDDDVTVVAGSADDTEATSGDDEMGAMFGSDEHRDEDTGTQRLEDDEAATQMLSEAEETQAMTSGAGSDDGGQDYTETVVGSDTQMLDENDPMSEADFHMAYGLYDQAADVIDKAIAANPSSKELKVKLAEIHFAANNADGFIAAATALKDQVGTGDSEWSNIAIMGKQIAGDNPLFADGGTGGGAVDLDFEAAGGEVSGDSGSDADVGVETEHASFDLPSEEPSADTSADSGSDEIDFDMDFGAGDDSDSDESAPAPVSDASSDDDDGALDFDLNLGEGDDSGADDEPLVDLSADSGDDDGLGDFGDFGGDLDSDLDSDLGGDLGGDLDAGDDASSDSGSDDDTQSEFDKALEELSAYVDTNQPDGGSESSAEEAGGDLNLDEFDFDSSASDSADDSGSDDDDDEGGLGEIGTKLDLAQAYIEMGDPDGARSILEEVLAEGDDEQKATAQSLIDSL